MTADASKLVEALGVLQREREVICDSLARYRRKADKVRETRGERDIHADRLCEWAEARKSAMEGAIEAIREAAAALSEAQSEIAALVESLEQERQHAKRTGAQLDEAVGRLNRLGDHLRALTVYAEGDDDHGPPADPFPDIEASHDGRG